MAVLGRTAGRRRGDSWVCDLTPVGFKLVLTFSISGRITLSFCTVLVAAVGTWAANLGVTGLGEGSTFASGLLITWHLSLGRKVFS